MTDPSIRLLVVCMGVVPRGRLWPGHGFEGRILVGQLTLLVVAYQRLPEDHTALVEVKVQEKVDSPASNCKCMPACTTHWPHGAAGASLEIDAGSLREMGIHNTGPSSFVAVCCARNYAQSVDADGGCSTGYNQHNRLTSRLHVVGARVVMSLMRSNLDGSYNSATNLEERSGLW